MPEVDMFAHTIRKLGEPQDAQKVPARDAARYADRVPRALIQFWRTHGRGSFEQGKFWICDPVPFQPIIDTVFHGDPELDPAEMTAIGYSAFGALKIWHRKRRAVTLDIVFQQVSNPPPKSWHDAETGRPFSPDYTVSCQLTAFQYGPALVDTDGEDLLPQAIGRLGRLAPGEIYGFVPALHLGGRYDVANLRRMDAAEHLLVVAETANFMLTRLTPPEPPANPYGRVVPVRGIGRI